MSSVRVPEDLRERLNEAAPPGMALHEVIAGLLEEAGGPEAVRRRLEEASRLEEARARVARLRREGHRSVCLDEGEQLALAQAAARWCKLLEERGRRRWDAQARTLEISPDPAALDEAGPERLQPQGRFGDDPGGER